MFFRHSTSTTLKYLYTRLGMLINKLMVIRLLESRKVKLNYIINKNLLYWILYYFQNTKTKINRYKNNFYARANDFKYK